MNLPQVAPVLPHLAAAVWERSVQTYVPSKGSRVARHLLLPQLWEIVSLRLALLQTLGPKLSQRVVNEFHVVPCLGLSR